jgi:hypothetical protein
VLLFFSLNVEADHMLFATDALRFFAEVGDRHNIRVDATSNWSELNDENLKQYKLVVWLNGGPPGAQQQVFQRYMENGGAWLGFHVSGFISRWEWFKQFIGGASFGVNNWPPLPARLIVDDTESPVTRGIPKAFVAPTNEWYSWRPSPRLDKNIQVLLTLDPSQRPLGIKGLITERDPDVPVVWTHAKQTDRERDALAPGCVNPLAYRPPPLRRACTRRQVGHSCRQNRCPLFDRSQPAADGITRIRRSPDNRCRGGQALPPLPSRRPSP